MTVLLAGVAVACIYAGYALFCGLPALKNQSRRSRILLLNVVPGVFLALAGAGLLTIQIRNAVDRPREVMRRPASQPTAPAMTSKPNARTA